MCVYIFIDVGMVSTEGIYLKTKRLLPREGRARNERARGLNKRRPFC